MARTSLVHYIAPSAISITPNCNDSVSDLAVYITRGAKIFAYSEAAGITMTGSGYQQWTLKGRNRRLNDSTKPYTIYIRLSKTDHDDAYLVFAARQQVQGVWKDKYPYVTKEGLYRDVYGQESSVYWYIRIGDVSLPGAGGREVTLDTGILGTQQYNEEWNLNPDSLPLRVELGCTIDGEDAGPTPYVYWGQDIVLEATLVEGWESIDNTRLDHWEIARQAEGQWPDQQRADAFASTGIISLQHSRDGEDDDFLGQVATVFQVNAWGYDDGDSSGSQQLVILGTASITILSEVIESFDIVMSSEVMNYSPQSGAYSPADGIDITLRATDQKGDILDVTYAQFSSLGLHLSYAAVGSDVWTPVTVSGQPTDIATGNIPASAFASGSSINVRLTRTEDGDSSGSVVEKELARKTIAFVSDGEDSAVREWIYRQDNTTGYDSKTGTAHGEPVSGKTGDDWNADLTDDFVPTGWSDNALPVSAQHPDVYTSWRDYDEETEKWGDFHTPVVWSHWGEKGTDGDGCQYVYKLFDHELTSQEREDNIPDKPDNPDEHGEWIPTGWSDDPQAPTREMPFCYCSVIRQIGGVWGLFQKLGLWSKWSEDGMSAALCFVERGAVFVPTDISGVVLEDFQIRVPFRVYAGNERLEVSDASIDEGDSAHYAHLFGGIVGMVGTVSGSKLSITGSTVQDTKLMLSGNHVVGNTEIVIDVQKGTTLDEHMVNLTVYSRNAIGTEYTSYASLEILSNGVPRNGDTPISVYKWNTSPDTPPAISGNDYPPTGWSKSAPDRPEGDNQYLWVSYTIKRGDGTIMDWGTPVRISGDTGSAGEDAKEREWVYKVSDTNPGTPANPEDRTIDDYVPAGWTDSPTGVTATARTEWASWRDFDHETELWGDFHAPVVWSHYGENGMDGDGVEYVFIRTNTLVAPTIVDSPDSRTDSHGHTYLDDEYLPLATGGSLGTSQVECTDNPAGTSRLNPYEWVAKRTKGPADTVTGKRTWEKFSGEMSLWANYSENAIRLDLDDEMDMINTDSTGKVDVARTITVHATLYDGARAGTSATLVSTAASLAIGGVTPSLSIYNGVVTASWAFTRSNTLSTAATVSIIVQYNGVNYTASFTVAPSLGEAVYQIVPSMSTVPFERDTEGNLTPASRAVGLTIVKIDGQSTTSYTTAAQAGVTVRYSTTAMPSSASAGTGWSSGDITVANSVEMLYIAMFNSAGTMIDRETVPVVKDGKDGASTPLCILERSAVFVPTDSTGKVVEAFQKIVTFKVQLGNDILAVKSASVSEEGSAHYVQLHGGKLAGGPMSVSGTKVSLVGTVSGTKVKVGSSYTAGPSGLVITVPKNTVLDEHLAGVTVDVIDDKGREYTAYGSLEILGNGIAKDGTSQVAVFKWSTSGTTAPAISGTAYPPSGWSINPPNRPSGDGQFLWASYATRYSDGTIAGWGTPVRISGNDGSAGEDAKEREWIYKRSDTNPGTPPNPSDRTIDDYVPAGWSDNPSGVDDSHKTEWASWRDFNHDTDRWGDFHAPVVWSHYGERGMDGDGVEYVYIRTKTSTAPTIKSDSTYTDTNGKTYTSDEHLPQVNGSADIENNENRYQCTDDPKGTDRTWKYEWVIKRTKKLNSDGKTRTWEYYSGAMSLWANFSENVVRLDLDNEMDMVNTDSVGKVDVARTITTHATLYDGSQVGTAATLVSTAASLAIGGVTPTVSISNGVVTASWAFTRSNTLSTAATVTIIVQFNGSNYSASFTIAPSLGEAVYQIVPSMSSVPFSRDSSGALTPASRGVGLTIVKVDGQSTTSYTTAASAGVTVRYSTTAMPSSASAGTGWSSGDITVANNVDMLYIAMFNSAGTMIDRETVPVVKEGQKGAKGDDGKDAATLIVSPSNITYPATPGGSASAAYSVGLAAPKIMINGTKYDCTTFTVDTSTVSGVTYTSSGRTLTVSSGASPNGTIIATGTYTSGGTTWTATIAITIGPERKRAIVRGPKVWQKNTQYYSGQIGESYLDIVVYEGKYYQCVTTHTSSTTFDSSKFQVATEFGFIASGLILSEQALIRNLVVEELKALKEEGVAAGNLAYGTYSAVNPGVFEIGTYQEVAVGSDKETNYQPRYEVTFQIKNGKKYPVITFYDENGTKIGDLDESIFANVETVQDSWNMMNLIFAGSTQPTHSDYNTYASAAGNTFYQFFEGYNKNSGTGVYTYTFGQRTGASTYDRTQHNGSNGRWQKSMDGTTFKQGDGSSSVGATGNGMRTGYYVKAGPYKVRMPGLDGRVMERMQMDVYQCTTGSAIGSYYYSGVLTKVGVIDTEWKDSGLEPIEP